MARAGGRYSQVVAWLKILLPLSALALMSTMFLVARQTGSEAEIPFAEQLREAGRTDEQVGSPYFAGTTERGDALTFEATRARPVSEGRIAADELTARIGLTDGGTVDFRAPNAMFTDGSAMATLSGGVEIDSSTGYRVQTESLKAAIDRIDLESDGEVRADGPAGTLTAGKMRILPSGPADEVQMIFTGGVKMVYEPQNPGVSDE